MRAIIKAMYTAQIFISAAMILITVLDLPYAITFAAYVIWVTSNFFQAGLTIGNLGHIAGLAASVISSVSTVGAVLFAVPIALLFDGTPLPMAIGILVMSVGALWLTTLIRRPGEV